MRKDSVFIKNDDCAKSPPTVFPLFTACVYAAVATIATVAVATVNDASITVATVATAKLATVALLRFAFDFFPMVIRTQQEMVGTERKRRIFENLGTVWSRPPNTILVYIVPPAALRRSPRRPPWGCPSGR